eukprot:scaffold2217_cov132-Isochrysis_galbana.AAC.12
MAHADPPGALRAARCGCERERLRSTVCRASSSRPCLSCEPTKTNSRVVRSLPHAAGFGYLTVSSPSPRFGFFIPNASSPLRMSHRRIRAAIHHHLSRTSCHANPWRRCHCVDHSLISTSGAPILCHPHSRCYQRPGSFTTERHPQCEKVDALRPRSRTTQRLLRSSSCRRRQLRHGTGCHNPTVVANNAVAKRGRAASRAHVSREVFRGSCHEIKVEPHRDRVTESRGGYRWEVSRLRIEIARHVACIALRLLRWSERKRGGAPKELKRLMLIPHEVATGAWRCHSRSQLRRTARRRKAQGSCGVDGRMSPRRSPSARRRMISTRWGKEGGRRRSEATASVRGRGRGQ